MTTAFLRLGVLRFAAAFFAGIVMADSMAAQVALSSGTYSQTFDSIGGGLPPGWSVYTGATATATGTAASPNLTAVSWSSTTGQWANVAAADNNGTPFTGTEAVAAQAAATDRALGIRQTGSFGDPGASANFNFSTIGQQVTSISFSAQMLSVQTRSTGWSVQYGVGAAPATWVTVATYSDPGAFGTTTVTASGFGTALDNQSNVSLRVVALTASTGAGSRDTFGIDDFTIVTAATSGDTPPSIVTPPAAQAVNEGDTVQFTVSATGTAPLVYQWRKDSAPLSDGGIISGAATATLTLSGVSVGDAGSYDVFITNTAGSATSAPASLVVHSILQAPSITTQPVSQSVGLGGTANFSVTATGTAPLAYQWCKDGLPLSDGATISGSATASLTVSSVTADAAGTYDVVVSNSVNPAATSNPATLSVTATITPSDQIAYVGGSYAQSFDTLPSSGTFTLTSAGPLGLDAAPIGASGLGGWSLAKYSGTGTVALFRVDAGTGTSGSIYSYGSTGSTDRAFGSLSSGSTISRFGVALVNSTGRTITQFTLNYMGEQWRRGTGAANRLTFEFATDATDLNNGTFVAAPTLDFVAPVTTGSGVALDGNAAANRVPVSATVTGLTWAPGQALVLRWTDVDDTGSDDGLAIDDLSFSTPVASGDILPAVIYTTPANGAVNVPGADPLSVTFNEAVNFTTASFTLNGGTSGTHPATLSGGPASYTLTPVTPFAEGETVSLTVLAAQVTDAATGTQHPGGDVTTTFITFSNSPLPIHTVQGSGLTSPYAGHAVTVQGVVTASFQGTNQIGGYYIEAPDAAQDADPATSEGIYVFDNTNSVTAGDLVTVAGTVSEFGTIPNTETEISAVTSVTINSSGNPLPTAVAVTLPFPATGYAERYESMRVIFPQSLTVTDNFDLGIFGELLLSNGRLSTPTNIVAPGAPAQALEAANLLNQVTLDDGLNVNDPDPTPYLNSSDPTTATRRTGSTTLGVTGILDNKFGVYVVEPTAVPVFVDANPRSGSPASTGSLRVAIGNVENFMNGDGMGGAFPTSRGATTEAEYERQLPKVTAGILGLAPDIMGLTEIENDRVTNGAPDSYGPTSAIAELVASLNAGAPSGTTYAFVNAAAVDVTTDQIHVALIYNTQKIEAVGAAAMLNDPAFNDVARNPLAQTFREIATGGKLTVCINHLRAKGGAATGAGNTDSGDGQGTNNALRVQEAHALTTWLATDPTGSGDPDFLIIGDLNSYAKEDPIVAIENAGFTSLTERFEGEGGYSYSFNGEFGHLDHALASASFNPQVNSAATWHVNSDEPTYYDYNVEFKSVAQQAINVGTPYRYSDHDPVVIGVTLVSAPIITAQLDSQTAVAGSSVTFQVTVTGTPTPTYQWRLNGVPIAGATSATYTISNVLTADAGSYDVVVSNSEGSITSNAATLVVNPGTATVVLSNLTSAYDGTAKPVTVVTTSAGLPVTVTYNGSPTPPVNPGTYTVVATINSPDYTGTASGTEVITVTGLIRHAPTLNAGVEGSLQILLPESITLNGSAFVSGDLLVPGLPTIKLNGHPLYGSTIDSTGAATPSNYTITLNNNAALRHVVRRVDALSMPVVTAPPAPTGTRNVSLNSPGQSPGDFATLRNLTLNSNAGQLTVPAGTYGAFTVNGSSSLAFGVAGATQPSIYNLQSLTLNGTSHLSVVGPVILKLANGTSLSGSMGTAGRPEWLDLEIASGGLTLNSNVTLDGFVTAPSGTITINGNCTLTGEVSSDRLVLNGNGVLIEP
ncbi:MAG TPA: ExeM/NucH family extracellular endonuclease [Lacunisphaera sp.]|jgi:hypothetical protein